jgi:hypothetical protein
MWFNHLVLGEFINITISGRYLQNDCSKILTENSSKHRKYRIVQLLYTYVRYARTIARGPFGKMALIKISIQYMVPVSKTLVFKT